MARNNVGKLCLVFISLYFFCARKILFPRYIIKAFDASILGKFITVREEGGNVKYLFYYAT